MTRLSALIGQPAITLADAEPHGKIDGAQFDGRRVVGLRTKDGLIETSAIRTFEGDAITFDGAISPAADDADSPLGRRVLGDDGDERGRLVDLDLDDDGTITAVVLDDGQTLDGTALRVIGPYAVIVSVGPNPPAALNAGEPPTVADATDATDTEDPADAGDAPEPTDSTGELPPPDGEPLAPPAPPG